MDARVLFFVPAIRHLDRQDTIHVIDVHFNDICRVGVGAKHVGNEGFRFPIGTVLHDHMDHVIGFLAREQQVIHDRFLNLFALTGAIGCPDSCPQNDDFDVFIHVLVLHDLTPS